ncbi:prenyltransferase/squalene oxidase repeat-containing protein [Nannocystis bainbridge]|uniref:Prenyltransferase/squalene oxidase repeat-containing protein n=1 Tax=Nannocystis bainbridge TaxID=2995303 RepID=A0ABT5E3L7_9BACT|nr:prenyltransferase/squalene oxidase repeat-containing protein [Nannocystis bainbridge]MDC0720460.1 prenyltransferase/squalene oxidase repeat-containing protein [Nannocystis bainbridge]
MLTGIGVLEQIEPALERAVQFMLDHRLPDGRLAAGCAGRALESALALHLLRTCGHGPALQAEIAGFCRRWLADDDDESSHASRLDRTLSRILCELVVHGRLGAEGLVALQQTLAAFDHPTLWRKRVLVEVLLVELGALPPGPAVLPLAVVRAESSHLWVTILLASIRVLQLCQSGRADEVGDAELAPILGAQATDGSWEQHVLVTIVALLALTRLGRAAPHRALGLNFIAGQLRPGGGVPFITNEDVWVTCLAGLVLTEARRPAHELQRCEQFLVSQQQPDGGWAYAEGVSQTDADDTSITLSLLVRRNPVIHRPSIRRAVAHLLALQNSDGGFPTFVRGAASEAEITAKSITALRASHMAPPGVLEAAWAWLARAQQANGGFRGEWKLCATYPAFHVINAAAGERHGSHGADIRRRCVGFLRGLRRPDGGWPIHPDDDRSHVLSTAYALGGLAACPGSLTSGELYASAQVLLAGQGRSGGFTAEADSLGPRPFVYDVPLLATLYSVWALSRVRDQLSGRAHEVPFGALAPRLSLLSHDRAWISTT